MYLLGFEIGGTKCAVMTATWENEQLTLLRKDVTPTDHSLSPTDMIDRLIDMADAILTEKPVAVGISCGGPLNDQTGVILGPPNLPGWQHVEIVKQLQAHYGVPTHLQNDANACAVAEWKFGAGRGCRNMVFLTFGTGLGAGLILNGRLYSGENGNAGEVGHVRLAPNGPVGFGKSGSFEGFCSGGGIAQLGLAMARERAAEGKTPAYYREGMSAEQVTAKSIAEAALAGDETALEVYRTSGHYLGRGLSILIDILNPERIVIGSIFARNGALLWESAKEELAREALAPSLACCEVVPAALGEQIGDVAAIATALLALEN